MTNFSKTLTSNINPPLPVSRRGTQSEHSSFTGLPGEITVVTDDNSLRAHDGTTAGGAVITVPGDSIVLSTGTTVSLIVATTATAFAATHRIAVTSSTGTVFYIPAAAAW